MEKLQTEVTERPLAEKEGVQKQPPKLTLVSQL